MSGRSYPTPTAGQAIAANGFSAKLEGASLFDLIQLECTSRGRSVVRVTSEGRSALMYFSEGRIVHAAAGRTTGEAAVRELLTWGKGTFARFDHFDGAWPMLETIAASTESVLLRAVQAIDERQGKVVALPVREGQAAVTAPTRELTVKPPRRPAAITGDGVELALRLSNDGELLERHGHSAAADDDDGFCDAVAYAAQLTDLVGELLGQGPFENVELTFQQGKCVMCRRPEGDVVALKAGARGTLEGLRQQLGVAKER